MFKASNLGEFGWCSPFAHLREVFLPAPGCMYQESRKVTIVFVHVLAVEASDIAYILFSVFSFRDHIFYPYKSSAKFYKLQDCQNKISYV